MKSYIPALVLCFCSIVCLAQPKGARYSTVSKDKVVTISYCTTVTETEDGDHVVWVKADYHVPEWRNYLASLARLRIPVYTTLTKAWYNPNYSLCMVRQVLLYSKESKLLFDTGESGSGGWGYVNASDPVGIVGEHLERAIR